MDYDEYRREITRAAEATGGEVVSLAGGYYGVQLMVDGGYLVLALDLDGDAGWVTWSEDQHGERCCDAAEEVIGPCLAHDLRERAVTAIAGHVHA